jgi:hypothetical protein
MDIPTLLILFVSGCLTGFLAGLFGVGGGVVLVPILLYLFSDLLGISGLVATHLVFGTSLLIAAVTSLSSAFQYYKNGHVVIKASVLIGIASIVAALVGAVVAAGLQGKTLQQVFAAVVAFAAVRLMLESERSRPEREMNESSGALLTIGVVAGGVSSLAGVGGGVFSIPMLYTILGFPLKKALGTSSAAIVITSLAAAIGYAVNGLGDPDIAPYSRFAFGYVDYLHAVPVIAGAVPFAKLGASAAHRTRTDRLRKIFAVFLLVIAVRMAF